MQRSAVSNRTGRTRPHDSWTRLTPPTLPTALPPTPDSLPRSDRSSVAQRFTYEPPRYSTGSVRSSRLNIRQSSQQPKIFMLFMTNPTGFPPNLNYTQQASFKRRGRRIPLVDMENLRLGRRGVKNRSSCFQCLVNRFIRNSPDPEPPPPTDGDSAASNDLFGMAVCRRSNLQREVWTDGVRPEHTSKTDQLKLQ